MFPRRRHQPGPLPECAKIPFLLADNGGDRRTGISPSCRTHHQARAHHQPWFNLLISKSAFANLMQKAQHLLLKRLRGSSKANIWEKVLSCHTSIHQESYPSLNSWESFGENACSASSSACLFGAFHTWCATQWDVISAVPADTCCEVLYLSQGNHPPPRAALVFQFVKIMRNKQHWSFPAAHKHGPFNPYTQFAFQSSFPSQVSGLYSYPLCTKCSCISLVWIHTCIEMEELAVDNFSRGRVPLC